jgi:hypothetical protein
MTHLQLARNPLKDIMMFRFHMDRHQTGHTVSRRTVPESTDHMTTESTNKWTEIAGQLIDRILGKNMSMTYDFQQLTIDMPKAEGPFNQAESNYV